MGFTLSLKVVVSLSEEKDSAAHLHTHNTGVGTIHLTAKCPLDICSPDGATFSDQVQIINTFFTLLSIERIFQTQVARF